MKRSPPMHWPQESLIPNTVASTGPPAKEALLRRAMKRLLNAGGSDSTSDGPAPKISRSDGAPGSGGRAATYAGGLQISQEALPEFREDFALFDQDGGGEISSDYHGVVMRAMGENPTHTELEEMIAKGDTNGNGTIDFSEFVAMKSPTTLTTLTENQIRWVFKKFDQDGNGFITAPDLRYVMTALGVQVTDEEVNEMIREADMDGDGQISYDEFVAQMTST